MASIALRGVTKRFAGGHAAVSGLDLDVAAGELLAIVGPSGSGKSTVLRLIAGLETADEGTITIDGADVTATPPQRRDVAMVFQNYALYPHKTVRGNMAFALQVRGMGAADIDARVRVAAATLDIDALLDRRPSQLSGGQRQRVALGRAIVREPKAFLLDEPLSNLDPRLRVDTRAELAMLHRRLGATMVYVTHDQEEAMTLGARVAVMRDGRIEQLAPPLELYRRPSNAFVAAFIGTPAMNLWACEVHPAGELARVTGQGWSIDAGPALVPPATHAILGVRPHDLALADDGSGDVSGEAAVVEPLGASTIVHVRVAGMRELVRLVVPGTRHVTAGQTVAVRISRDRLHWFDAEGRTRLEPRGI
jgi:ABC-type sugar transport system ATPase subunit